MGRDTDSFAKLWVCTVKESRRKAVEMGDRETGEMRGCVGR